MTTDSEVLATIPKNATEEVRVRRTEYHGVDLVDARVWTVSQVPGTEGKPTKKGLTLRPETWREVAAAVLAEIANEAPVEKPGEGTPNVDGEDPLGGDV